MISALMDLRLWRNCEFQVNPESFLNDKRKRSINITVRRGEFIKANFREKSLSLNM